MTSSCACSRSLAVICAVAAAGAFAALFAHGACRELGGRLSEAAWVCETAGSAIPFWSLVSVQGALLSLILAGVPVYLAVMAIGRRFGW